MEISHENIEVLLKKWQDAMRLRDWDINVKVVNTPWRKSADIKIYESTRTAVLMINHDPTCRNLEELVIHELLHLKLWGLDQMIEEMIKRVFGDDMDDPKVDFAYSKFFLELEPTVADLTKAFLTVNGSNEAVCFNNVNKQVEEELKQNRT